MLAAILRNDFDLGYLNWLEACKKYNIDYQVIELAKDDWFEQSLSNKYDLYLACPPGRDEIFKKLYDERIYILDKVLNKFVYPNFNEISVHENKRYLSYWLKANNIDHPTTHVFYQKDEADSFAKSTILPIVGKMNIGASGKGVKIIRDRDELYEYIHCAFTSGLRQEWGPNFKMGNYRRRISNILKNPTIIKRKLEIYRKNHDAVQKGFVLFQEYIEHQFEWRLVKIGDSYFGHQKVKQGDKASGTKGINYTVPSEELLNYVRYLCEKHDFNAMAIDLFEDKEKGFLVNELQCIFGHVQDYICENEGKPGRFKYLNNKWIFEEGMFNANLSYNLRLKHALSLIIDK